MEKCRVVLLFSGADRDGFAPVSVVGASGATNHGPFATVFADSFACAPHPGAPFACGPRTLSPFACAHRASAPLACGPRPSGPVSCGPRVVSSHHPCLSPANGDRRGLRRLWRDRRPGLCSLPASSRAGAGAPRPGCRGSRQIRAIFPASRPDRASAL